MDKRLARVLLSVVVAALTLGGACPKKATRDAPEGGDSPAAGPAPDERAHKAPPPPRFGDAAGERTVTVLYTASVEGYVEPCGCTAEPLGGVARYVAAVDEAKRVRGADHVLLLDGGDLLFERPDDNLPADACQTKARHELLLDTYRKAGLAYTVLGPTDDARGAGYRDQLLAAHGLTTLHAGLPPRDIPGAQPAALVERGGVKVGLVGLTGTALDVDQARAALAAQAKQLHGQGAAVVIALMQTPVPESKAIGRDLRGVDVMIQGRDPGERPRTPERLGADGPVLVGAGPQAQYLGVLEFVLDGHTPGAPLPLDDRGAKAESRKKVLDARIEQLRGRLAEVPPGSPKATFFEQKLIAAQDERAGLDRPAARLSGPHLLARAIELDRKSPVDTAAEKALAAYEKAVPDLVAQCEANITCEPAPAGAATYVGVQACFACHQDAVAFWQKARREVAATDDDGNKTTREVGHSKAWETLVQEGKHKDRTCVGCHSIGFNQPGGYCKVSDIDFRTDVQCEACHGPGSLHAQGAGDKSLLTVKSVDEAVCRGCHKVPHIPTTESFVFADKLQYILGPGHGEPLKSP